MKNQQNNHQTETSEKDSLSHLAEKGASEVFQALERLGFPLSHAMPAFWDAAPIAHMWEKVADAQLVIDIGGDTPAVRKYVELCKKTLQDMRHLYHTDITEYHNKYCGGIQTEEELNRRNRKAFLSTLSPWERKEILADDEELGDLIEDLENGKD